MKLHKSLFSQETSAHSTPNFFIGLLLFINCFCASYFFSLQNSGIDFFTWWSVPHSITRQYIELPYSDQARTTLAVQMTQELDAGKINVEKRTLEDVLKLYKGRIITTASPFFYIFFSGFVSNDYQTDKRKFVIVSLLCFASAVFLLGRQLNFSYFSIFLFYTLITVFFSPYASEVKVGNVNQIQLLLTALFIVLSIRAKDFINYVWAAFFLGISILLKPNTCFILLFAMLSAIFHKDIKRFAGYAVGFLLSSVVAFSLTALYFKHLHVQAWKDWLATLPTTMSGTFGIELGNYSLAKLINVYTGQDASLILQAILAGIFIWTLFESNRAGHKVSVKTQSAVKKERELKSTFFIVGFGTLIMLIGSGLVWGHYYIMTIPLFLFLMRPQIDVDSITKIHPLTKPLTYLALGLSTQIVNQQLPTQEVCAIKNNIVAFILLILLMVEVRRK